MSRSGVSALTGTAKLAAGAGFEPAKPCGPTDSKSGAMDRYATPPLINSQRTLKQKSKRNIVIGQISRLIAKRSFRIQLIDRPAFPVAFENLTLEFHALENA